MTERMTEKDVHEEMMRLCRNLRLGTNILSQYQSIPFDNPTSFVLSLLRSMDLARANERVSRLIQQAHFECVKTLDNFSFENLELPKGFPKSWFTECEFVKEKQNLILLGNPGTGKTHLATALGVKACELGKRTVFWRTSKLIEQLCAIYSDGQMPKFMNQIEKIDLLILDEWGYIPTNTLGTRLLFEVINACYEKKSVVITTNLPLAEWNRLFSDERLLNALMDRIVHHGLILKHTGESYRLTHALMT